MAIQMNWLVEQRGFRVDAHGRFYVDFDRIAAAVKELVSRILAIEAENDYDAAAKMIAQYGSGLKPEIEGALGRLTRIPVDIRPA